MKDLTFPVDEHVLIDASTSDDAGVYQISDDLALIQTVDFFTPVVDDPFDFGRIAAANALSDVYAMGGTPKTALNIVAFPAGKLSNEVLKSMLAGGVAKLKEAGVVLLGGHSVEDDELKYGLSVTGFIHPKKILANQGLHSGDRLILTKALGTGIIATAIKGGLASDTLVKLVTEQMAMLNKYAAEVLPDFHISACTDVTGFGLIGHLAEMIHGTKVGVKLFTGVVPMLPEAYEYAAMGLVPAGAHRNRNFRQDRTLVSDGFDQVLRDLLFDPQTSGGLLIGCPEAEADQLVERLVAAGCPTAAVIGAVDGSHPGQIELLG